MAASGKGTSWLHSEDELSFSTLLSTTIRRAKVSRAMQFEYGQVDHLFLATRAFAALRRFAMRLRAYVIGSSSTVLGS